MAAQFDGNKLNGAGFDSSLYLNPNEQDLLLTALNSNKPGANKTAPGLNSMHAQRRPDVESATTSPLQGADGGSFENSPYLDYELDDSNFDWDLRDQMIGGLPGDDGLNDSTDATAGKKTDGSNSSDADGEAGDKRKSPEDENEDDGGGKRREGEDKGSKKPGRKPLTSEPTTKRKAQNRAAQRAFRERKEKHLKDLESKVEDLEKASESANHENGLLRAQVERLQAELKEYRKRLSVVGTSNRASPPSSSASLSSKSNWEFNNNFNFAFPKFGPLVGGDPNAPLNRSNSLATTSPVNGRGYTSSQRSVAGTDDLRELFSPDVLASAGSRSNSTDHFPNGASNKTHRTQSETNTASPSSSVAHSLSQNGFTSSCATTPESHVDSPDQRKASDAAFNTSTEDTQQRRKSTSQEAFCKEFQTACGNKQNPVPQMLSESNKSPASASSTSNQPNTPGLDSNSFDWFATQNGGAFDPVLFGDYRDPQENIMNNDFGFFDSAFSMPEFNSPTQPLEPALPKKKDLMQQIEDTQAGKDTEVVPGENTKQFLTCNMLWDRVQRSQKVQSGEADMDELCSQLKSKAKCSGNGAVIEQRDVDAILGPAADDSRDFFKMFK